MDKSKFAVLTYIRIAGVYIKQYFNDSNRVSWFSGLDFSQDLFFNFLVNFRFDSGEMACYLTGEKRIREDSSG